MMGAFAPMTSPTGLLWFRNDLRMQDHPAMAAIDQAHCNWMGLYALDPKWQKTVWPQQTARLGPFRAQFLKETLLALEHSLAQAGIPFDLICDTPANALSQVLEANPTINAIYFHREWAPEERADEAAIFRVCEQRNVRLNVFDTNALYLPDEMPFSQDALPLVFTQYRRQIEKQKPHLALEYQLSKNHPPRLSNCEEIENAFTVFGSKPSPSIAVFSFRGGVQAAQTRLDHYFERAIFSYKHTRNGMLHADESSKFSPWLSVGAISPKQIFQALMNRLSAVTANESTEWFILELFWRDYFRYLIRRFSSQLFFKNGIQPQKSISWKQDADLFYQWLEGKTVEPFVNANMNELRETGWMSNRGRQNVASYLTKTLGIDWRWGAAAFESLLLDYDVYNNTGNWAYVAGVGTDPRDRVFNIAKQAQDYDPQGLYQQRWTGFTAD